jgi:DNA-directed RNA polymerase specialized sigma24 family protein
MCCHSPLAQRGEDGDAGVEPGREIDDQGADLHRLAAGMVGHAHQAADALEDVVVARASHVPVRSAPNR